MKKVFLITIFLAIASTMIAQDKQGKPSNTTDDEARVEEIIKEMDAQGMRYLPAQPEERNSGLPFLFFLFSGILYFGLCGAAAVVGSSRKVGAGWAFLISLFFTPLIGMYIAATSERKTTVEFRKRLTEEMNLQTGLLKKIKI